MTFLQTPYVKSIERMMMSIPNFMPRGHVIISMSKFEYTAEMCDCRLCPHYQNKKGCTIGHCPCIMDRITAGAATLQEILSETMSQINNKLFQKRLNKYMKESEGYPMTFKNEKHHAVFSNAITKLDHKNYALMAAVYLLTSECTLWNTVKYNIKGNTSVSIS